MTYKNIYHIGEDQTFSLSLLKNHSVPYHQKFSGSSADLKRN